MFNSNDCFTMPVMPAYSGGYGAGNGMWGDGGWIWLIVILGLFGGWGGFGGFGRGYGNYANSPDFQGYATRADINEGFAFNGLQRGVDAIQNGICDSTYALNNTISNGFHSTDLALCNGFNGVQTQISNLGYQIQQCCCDTQRAIDGVNYNMATNICNLQNTMNNNTRDIIDNQNAGTRAILDFLTQDKISTLTAENQALKFQARQTAQNAFITANQEAQTAELIRRLGADCPVNAYVVQPPTPVTFPTNCCGTFTGYNGCGNGCGC